MSVKALLIGTGFSLTVAGVAPGQTPEPVSPGGVAPSAASLPTPTQSSAKPLIVNGYLWLRSTNDQRKAFLIGAANMIALEEAYAEKKHISPPPAADQAKEALQGLTLDDIAKHVTAWYEANPTRHDVPVIGVIWIDMVKPAIAHK